MEDVWEDAAEEEIGKDTRVHLDHLYKDGFRTGVAQGQEEKVQTGFDVGYSEAMQEGMRWGKCQGILEMHQALASKGGPSIASPELDKAIEYGKGIRPADAYISIYNRLADAKQADLKSSGEMSVFPERIETVKKTHEAMMQLQTIVERWKEERVANRHSAKGI